MIAKNILSALLVSFIIPSSAPVFASQTTVGKGQDHVLYCVERKLGSHFYCDPDKEKKDRETKQAPKQSPSVQLAAISKELDNLKAKAILNPTRENVSSYIKYQRQQLDRASTFSDQWQRTIWQNSDLDYTLQRPVSTLGKRAFLDKRREQQKQTLQGLSSRYGMFYFYSQSCSACEIFSPILKAVANESGMHVVAVSMDGGPNRQFPNYVVNRGHHEKMGLTSSATPALVLYDNQKKIPVPIGTGILSADQISERIFTLTQTEVGGDY